MLGQVLDGNSKVMAGYEQSRTPGNNPVPVVIGITCGGTVETIFYVGMEKIIPVIDITNITLGPFYPFDQIYAHVDFLSRLGLYRTS